jgi:hypothetical protein
MKLPAGIAGLFAGRAALTQNPAPYPKASLPGVRRVE